MYCSRGIVTINVLWLFLMMLCVGLQCVIVVFPDQTHFFVYSKACLKQPLKEDQKLFFKTKYRLMQVRSIAECSKRAFCNTFDLHKVICPLFCLVLSGCLSQVLLYMYHFESDTVWTKHNKLVE